MYRLYDYRTLTEEPGRKSLDSVVMEFFEKHSDYTLLGGPYVYHGVACQAVVKYVETVVSCDSYYKLLEETINWVNSRKKQMDDIWGDKPNEFEGKEE